MVSKNTTEDKNSLSDDDSILSIEKRMQQIEYSECSVKAFKQLSLFSSNSKTDKKEKEAKKAATRRKFRPIEF